MSFHHVGPGAVLRTGAVALLGLVTAFLTCSTAVLAADPATPAAAAPASGAADGAPKTGASAIQNLAGRWQGQGKIEVAGGQNEQVKCIATYFIRDSGTGIEQNLRCASSSYKVDVQTKLKIVGDQVTGTWLEQTTNSSAAPPGRSRPGASTSPSRARPSVPA